MRAIAVRDQSQVAEARREAVALARNHGFDESDAGRVAIVTSELATNLIKHGDGGELLLGSFEDQTGTGIELLSLDHGRGIADVGASQRDGHSTAGSSGTGLGAIGRGSHFSDIYSVEGGGTVVLARLQVGQPPDRRPVKLPDHGAISVALAGEEACGDAWCRRETETGLALMVSDGLGHGIFAAEASHEAIRVFHRTAGSEPTRILEQMHAALRPTRGAAVAVAQLNIARSEITYAGVGNIASTVVSADSSVQRMVSNNGTVGHVAKRIRDFTYRLEGSPLVIMASDGLGTSWRLSDYPGLAQRHPTLIAAVLYRDHRRTRDDVTVLVVRGGTM